VTVLRLLALAGDINALIAGIRLRTPLQALAERQAWSLAMHSFHDCKPQHLAAADVVVVQRGDSRRAWQLQRAARRAGAAVVYEIDDLLTELPAHISNQSVVRARQRWLLRCLGEADWLSISTARLEAALREGHSLPPATVVPNSALPLGDVSLPGVDAAHGVSVLLVSMERLLQSPALSALTQLQAESAPLGPAFEVVVLGPAAADCIAAGLRVRAMPLMPRDQFIAFVRSLPNPLAVIPLEASRFAACKSAIKWFEYGEAGIPTLCSNVPPYSDVVAGPLSDTLVANTVADWLAALRLATGDAAWRQRTAVLTRTVVRRDHTLEHTLQAWQDAIEQAVAARAAATLPLPGWTERVLTAAQSAGSALLLPLRRFNRQRLARRRLP
jgi:hypothetical protein